MIKACKSEITAYPRSYSYWLSVGLRLQNPGYEVVAVGPNAQKDIKKLQQLYTLNCSWAAAEKSDLPLFTNRTSSKKTRFYFCRNNQCELPVKSIEDAKIKLQELTSS
jgi:uncharacterized protein YyaL (SSP411 family)